MEMTVIGQCSRCGGDVQAYTGVWMAVVPPPPPKCVSCGAVAGRPVIQTYPVTMPKVIQSPIFIGLGTLPQAPPAWPAEWDFPRFPVTAV